MKAEPVQLLILVNQEAAKIVWTKAWAHQARNFVLAGNKLVVLYLRVQKKKTRKSGEQNGKKWCHLNKSAIAGPHEPDESWS